MCAVMDRGAIRDGSTFGAVYTCNRCGHIWVTRKADGLPRSCPKCRSVIWNKNCKMVKCLRCGHQWISTKKRPSRCPGCHTARWDVPVSPEPVKVRRPAVVDPDLVERIRDLYYTGMTAVQISVETGLSFQTVYSIVCSLEK